MKSFILALFIVGLFAAPSSSVANEKQPCDLNVASSVANARIKATCVKANQIAKSQGKDAKQNPACPPVAGFAHAATCVMVHSDACHRVGDDVFVFDCNYVMEIGATSSVAAVHCNGVIRVRGLSRNPRALHTRSRGFACI
jgi:hypothetical protein